MAGSGDGGSNGGAAYNPLTVEEVFRDFKGRRRCSGVLPTLLSRMCLQSRQKPVKEESSTKRDFSGDQSGLRVSQSEVASKLWLVWYSPRSIKKVKTKLQMKQEGAIRRKRVMGYALTHQKQALNTAEKEENIDIGNLTMLMRNECVNCYKKVQSFLAIDKAFRLQIEARDNLMLFFNV